MSYLLKKECKNKSKRFGYKFFTRRVLRKFLEIYIVIKPLIVYLQPYEINDQ